MKVGISVGHRCIVLWYDFGLAESHFLLRSGLVPSVALHVLFHADVTATARVWRSLRQGDVRFGTVVWSMLYKALRCLGGSPGRIYGPSSKPKRIPVNRALLLGPFVEPSSTAHITPSLTSAVEGDSLNQVSSDAFRLCP